MELLQLKYFCHAAKTENFSKTAEAFLVPTSNISQSIKRLETELGEKLFNRSANRIKLNKKGKEFYDRVNMALNILEDAKSYIANEQEITLRICILMHRHIIMKSIEDFRKKYPKCNFITTHTMPDDLFDYDIVVTDQEISNNFSKTVVAEEDFVLAYNKNFFSFSEKLSLSELADTSFISMDNESSVFKNTLTICKKLGFSPKIALQSEDPFYVRKCIELGLGVSFVPSFSWQGMFSDEIDFKDIGNHSRKINIYQNRYSNNTVNAFKEHLISAFSNQ